MLELADASYDYPDGLFLRGRGDGTQDKHVSTDKVDGGTPQNCSSYKSLTPGSHGQPPYGNPDSLYSDEEDPAVVREKPSSSDGNWPGGNRQHPNRSTFHVVSDETRGHTLESMTVH